MEATAKFVLQVAIKADKNDVIIAVIVKPRSKTNAITGVRGEALIVSVIAAPVDGAANAAVLAVLSEALAIPKSTLSIAHGHKSREKAVRISGCSLEDMRNRLALLPGHA